LVDEPSDSSVREALVSAVFIDPSAPTASVRAASVFAFDTNSTARMSVVAFPVGSAAWFSALPNCKGTQQPADQLFLALAGDLFADARSYQEVADQEAFPVRSELVDRIFIDLADADFSDFGDF
jgi:hypothetical protein